MDHKNVINNAIIIHTPNNKENKQNEQYNFSVLGLKNIGDAYMYILVMLTLA